MWKWLFDSGNLTQSSAEGHEYPNCSRRDLQLLRTRSQRGRHGPIRFWEVVTSVTHIGTYAKQRKNWKSKKWHLVKSILQICTGGPRYSLSCYLRFRLLTDSKNREHHEEKRAESDLFSIYLKLIGTSGLDEKRKRFEFKFSVRL